MEQFENIRSVLVAGNDLRSLLDKRLEPLGLSLIKVWALQNIVDRDDVTISDLAHLLDCGRSNASQLVERMERDGLVTRKAHLTDRRVSLIVVPDNARELLASSLKVLRDVDRHIGAEFDVGSLVGAVDTVSKKRS
ncbi:MarR family winged helix-turn-helix transcriptional regulator [uncultured Roseobacter sp.]|uniref:MarR family winged helix-turn-helix transcriptional regulator n=1 Tax=uncultured Roseobacter sp. TaxID=114847 RepID=UPI002609A49F|nr:MarR family winged helix-turn-helix transcriptional regulator [uncultured Roseobacter sp.]